MNTWKASIEDLERWFDRGVELNAVWLIVTRLTSGRTCPLYSFVSSSNIEALREDFNRLLNGGVDIIAVAEVYLIANGKDAIFDRNVRHMDHLEDEASFEPVDASFASDTKAFLLGDSSSASLSHRIGKIAETATMAIARFSEGSEDHVIGSATMMLAAMVVRDIASKGGGVSCVEAYDMWRNALTHYRASLGDFNIHAQHVFSFLRYQAWNDVPEEDKTKLAAWLGVVNALLSAYAGVKPPVKSPVKQPVKPHVRDLSNPTIPDPKTYAEMSVPIDSKEDLIKNAQAFETELTDIRRRYRVRDLAFVMEMHCNDGDAVSTYRVSGHVGDQMKAELMFAAGIANARIHREKLIASMMNVTGDPIA